MTGWFRRASEWTRRKRDWSCAQAALALAVGGFVAFSPRLFGVPSGLNEPPRPVIYGEYEVGPDKGLIVPIPPDGKRRLTVLAGGPDMAEAVALSVVGYDGETGTAFVKQLIVPKGQWVAWHGVPQTPWVQVEVVPGKGTEPATGKVRIRTIID